MNEDERNYYNQLHETARTYQAQIWTVPAVFLALQGALLLVLDFNTWFTFKNAIIFLVDAVFSYLLSLQFIKTYLLELLIQVRINAIDDKFNAHINDENERFRRIPLYSITPGRFLHKLENASIELRKYQRHAIVTQVGNKFSFLMRSVCYLSLILSIIISFILIYKTWPFFQ